MTKSPLHTPTRLYARDQPVLIISLTVSLAFPAHKLCYSVRLSVHVWSYLWYPALRCNRTSGVWLGPKQVKGHTCLLDTTLSAWARWPCTSTCIDDCRPSSHRISGSGQHVPHVPHGRKRRSRGEVHTLDDDRNADRTAHSRLFTFEVILQGCRRGERSPSRYRT